MLLRRLSLSVHRAVFYACVLGIVPWMALADSTDSGWLYVQDPRFELRVWGASEVKDYEIKTFGRSPGVADELLDVFSGTLKLNAEKQWADGGKLVFQGNIGDPTLRIKFKAQGSVNWSARKRNFYPGKEWDTLTLVSTGVLPGLTGRYENAGESGPNFDEYLTLQETPGGVLFDLQFAMAGEELVNQFARRASKDTFLFKRSASSPGGKGDLARMQIKVIDTTDESERGAEPMAYKVTLDADNSEDLTFPWNRIRGRTYQKLAPGGVSSRAFRLHAKPLSPEFNEGLEKVRKADAVFSTDRSKAVAAYLEASVQLGGGTGLAQALADHRGNGKALRAAIRNAAAGVDFGLETLWCELGWTHGDLYIDPAFILKLYREMGLNPEERHAGQAELMQVAVEAGTLDVNAFVLEHHLKVEDLRASPYAIWELASEASKGGRFGKANAKLALQLVLRGGGNLAEREAAIRQCLAILQGVRNEPFEPAECVRSRVGKAYLLSRTDPVPVKAAEVASSLSSKLSNDNLRAAFATANFAAEQFSEEESLHYSGCRGFFSWESNRLAYKEAVFLGFLQEVSSVLSGKMPEVGAVSGDSEAALAGLMANLHGFMRGPVDEAAQDLQDPAQGDSFYFSEGEGANLENVWKVYRDAVSQFLHTIRPERDATEWKRWMNVRRLEFLLRFKNENR